MTELALSSHSASVARNARRMAITALNAWVLAAYSAVSDDKRRSRRHESDMEQNLNELNREAIQAARQHMGHFAWGTVALSVAVLVIFVGNIALFAAGIMPLWAAFVIFAASSYMSYTPVHEAAHGNIHGRNQRDRWVGELCGYLCAPMIMLPHSSHRLEHLNHHRYTNDPARDPDQHIK